MMTRAASRLALGAALLLVAAAAPGSTPAQTISTARLLYPTDLFQESSSPTGERIAALRNDGGQVVLVVATRQNGRFRPAVSTFFLRKYHSVASYRWLTDDYLLLQVEDLVSGWQIPVVAGIPDDSWRPLPIFSQLIKYPWGDRDHALLQESGRDCNAAPEMSFCLFSLNVNHWGGQLISDPLSMLPLEFLPVSPAEIYASGRQINGQHREYHLDPSPRWRRVPDGTVTRQRASLARAEQPAASMMDAAARAGINHPTFVLTSPGDRLVGIIGHAPEPAFVATDPKLEGVQRWLAANYPTARVSISGLNDALTRGQVTVWGADLPPTAYLLESDGTLARFDPVSPQITSDQLGRTYMEPAWAPGEAVAVTMPPQGVATIGAVVMPVIATATELDDPLYTYRADVQAFAQQGLAVAQLLVTIPDTFASNADGAAWRAIFAAHLEQVVDHASSELLHGGPVCLYGQRLAGELALAAGGTEHIGCVAAVNSMLNGSQLSKSQIEGLPRGFASLAFRWIGPSERMLHQEIPAVFGNASGQLVDSRSWISQLPHRLMLAYDKEGYTDPTRGYAPGDFASGSGPFRSAAHKGGTQVAFYAPDPRFLPISQRRVRMLDAVTRYLHDYFAAGGSSPSPRVSDDLR